MTHPEPQSDRPATPATPDPGEILPVPIAAGPCLPEWSSLGDHFRTPTWWREAKIGMWLHWGPQALAEAGDWYAKWIYVQKYQMAQYEGIHQRHVERFGHPSEFGYKDILRLWKAEKWDPERLMALYHRAGARYVLGQAMHHDNFDLWDSKHQGWNSLRIGPGRDILGGWRQAARNEGMRFGIAFHGDFTLWWFQPAFLSDLDGAKQGVPYDAAQDYSGRRTWWKDLGLELKDLYGIDLKADVTLPADWQERGLTAYRMQGSHGIAEGDLPCNRDFAVWHATTWTRRVIDAIDQHSPDFIYFDGADTYPYSGVRSGRGLRADATPRVIAHFYNTSMARNGGRLEGIAFTKGSEDRRAVAHACESGVPGEISRDIPWQTEVGLGEWFYKAGTFYDSGMVIHHMLEALCKDGNYLINIPLNAAGELDPGGVRTLEDMAGWMTVNGEGIHGSSAWRVWGEGEVVMAKGNLGHEHAATPYTAHDIRFTTKGEALYAYLMAWPDDARALITALRQGSERVLEVSLLGAAQAVTWRQTAAGLEVDLPAQPPGRYAHGLRITLAR